MPAEADRSLPSMFRSGCGTGNVVAYLGVTALLLFLVLRATHGHFTYCLDDPYIHLALADRLRHGLYGINAGEPASPSSSVLWPLLLVPFAGTRLMPWMPLVLNIVFSAGTAWLLGRFADRYFAPDWRRRTLALLLLVATNIFGLTFTGLEHPLEVLLCVAGAFAVLHVLDGERVPWVCVLAAALLPSVRYEGVLITFAVAVALWVAGARRTALALLPVSLVPPAALSVALHRLGLPWFPLSVLVKSSYKFQDHSSLPVRAARLVWNTLVLSLEEPERAPQLLLAIVLGYFAWRLRRSARERLLLAGCALAGAAQVLLGPVGWFYRYEIYCLAFTLLVGIGTEIRLGAPGASAGVASGAAPPPASRTLPRPAPGLLLVLVAALAMFYAKPLLNVPRAALGIYQEQVQLGRFASQVYDGPVAVNDLGWVAFDRTPRQYVLDLVGLGSYEAFRTKEPQRTPAWLDGITREHAVGLVMIYPEWFPKGVPATWKAVAKLCASGVDTTLGAGSSRVMFYATPSADTARLLAQLRQFQPSLPPGSTLQLLPADASESCSNAPKL